MISKLDAFLRLPDRDILEHAGRISHDAAIEKAEGEYQSFAKTRETLPTTADRDFEAAMREMKQIESGRPKTTTRGKRK